MSEKDVSEEQEEVVCDEELEEGVLSFAEAASSTEATEDKSEDEPGEEGEGEDSSAEEDGLAAEVYKDRWIRLAAEFDNYKKRTLREREALIQSANAGLLGDLLPIVDSVDRANAHADGDTESDAFKAGLRMSMEEFPKILANRGPEEIDASGQPFDPNLHEALMQVASPHEAGTVAEVVERGYRLGDKVLRHAKVVVSQGPAPDTEEKSE